MFQQQPQSGVGLGAYASVYEQYAIGMWQAKSEKRDRRD